MNRPAIWRGGAIAASLAAFMAGIVPAMAQQDYPNRAVRLVVPYPPGGGTDVIARILQDRLHAKLGQPVVIENRGGAAGSIGTENVAKATADGYSVLFTLSSHTINPAIFSKLSFDTRKDFDPVVMVASLPQLLAAHPDTPVKSVADLIALAKREPNKLSFASVGNGSPGHLAGEMFKRMTSTDMVHVPYRGGGPAVADVMGGQVPLIWVSIPAAAQQVKNGKLKALAVSTVKRSAAFPDVPTVQEAGIAGFEVDSWYAMFVPAGTPKPIVEKLNRVVNEILAEADIKDKLLQQGSEGVGGPPEHLGKVVDAELPRWAKLARESGIRGD